MVLNIIFSLFSLTSTSFGLSPKEVVDSSLKNYPLVIQSILDLTIAQGELTSSKGAFDTKIIGEADSRTAGFYDGDYYKGKVEKNFGFSNLKLYGGLRQSFGIFPDYEGKMETLNEGEAFLGVSLSLLRDSLIDVNRFNLGQQKLALKQSEIELEKTKILVQTMALNAYWTWYVKGHELSVYKGILKLARDRAKQIKRRVKLGDLARIYATENNQYIRKREAQVIKGKLDFDKAGFYLALFYRDSEGKPIPVRKGLLPPLVKMKPDNISDFGSFFSKALSRSLELKNLDYDVERAKINLRLGKNLMLPKLDLNLEWNQDQGNGSSNMRSSSLMGDENRITLSLQIPLENRKARGKLRVAKAKLDSLSSKRQLVTEKMKAEIQSLWNQLEAFRNIYGVTYDQISLARKLAKAEVRKFSQGASDLILVNLREENLAETQIKNLETLLKYRFIEADVRRLQVEFY